jgi:3',5'-cyclic AMP phosphodiesterase CpdA
VTEVVIHHVSDIHIGLDHFDPTIRSTGEHRDPSFAFRFRSYVEFLERSGEHAPDLVVLSGDFVSKGQNTQEFETAYELTERLIVAVNRRRAFSPYRVCLVPGNHDLDWSRDTYEEKIENFRNILGRLNEKAVVCEVSERPTDFRSASN